MANRSDTFLIERIAAGVASLGQEISQAGAAKLAWLVQELGRWNRRMNLTSIRDIGAMVDKHLLDSLAVRPLVYGKSLVDIGSGAGFPGLPIAIAEPELAVELLDSNARKVGFLQHVIGELGISNASAVRSRAENYAPGKRFDTVTARALAPLPSLIELGGHLVAPKGVMLALKGRYPADELENMPDGWEYEVTELSVPSQDSRHVVVLRHRRACA